jgi:hypothetical protein
MDYPYPYNSWLFVDYGMILDSMLQFCVTTIFFANGSLFRRYRRCVRTVSASSMISAVLSDSSKSYILMNKENILATNVIILMLHGI